MSTAVTTAEPPADKNTLFGFPINRVVAFLTPFTVIIAGKVGLWLFANVGLFNTFNISHEKISAALVQVFAFAIPAVLTYMTHHKFLSGWQGWEQAVVHAAATPAPVTVVNTGGTDAADTVDDETDIPIDPPSEEDLSTHYAGEPPAHLSAPVPGGLEPEGDVTKFGEGADTPEGADA